MDLFIQLLLVSFVVILLLRRILPVRGVKQLTTTQLKNELSRKDVEFIDVRTKGEFSRYHIPGFQNIPLHELSKKVDLLSKEKEVIVICQSGMRSHQATRIFKKKGFTKVTNIRGGISAWK